MQSVAPPIFSVSQFTTWHQTFEQDVALYKRLGVGGIEVCERKLSTDFGKAREQLAMVRDAGLRVTSVQPRVHAMFPDFMCPDVHDCADRMKRYRATIDLFTHAFPDQNLPFVTISGKAPGGNFRDAHAVARKHYRELTAYAADKGARIAYEPLSPVLMNDDTFICTLDGAMRLIDDIDRPSTFGLMLDVWHVWSEPDLPRRVEAIGERIFGVHISDWPAGEPRCPGDRLLPGDGVIDLPTIFGSIDRAGYDDAYCMEIFSADALPDSLWRADPANVIERGRAGFYRAWEGRR
jgi:sugar phosphate isomerase/epimerase